MNSEINTSMKYKVGYAYVPEQTDTDMYDEEKSLNRGTVYEALDIPFGVYGVYAVYGNGGNQQ